MECPRCGFVLDPFMTECPRCAREQARPVARAPAKHTESFVRKECPFCGSLIDQFEEVCPRCSMLDEAPPRVINPPEDVPGPKTPRKLCIFCDSYLDPLTNECPQCSPPPVAASAPPLKKIAAVARDTAKSIEIVPWIRLPSLEDPELGWALTVLLWCVIMLNGATIAFWVAAAVGIQLLYNSDNVTHVVGMQMFSHIFNPSLRLVGTIGILRLHRWGFYIFCLFSVWPAVMAIAFPSGDNPILLLLDIVPALMIFVLALAKWDRLE